MPKLQKQRSVVVPIRSDDPEAVDQIIEDALQAVHSEVTRLSSKSKDAALTAEESKALNEYIRSMVLVRKDSRSALDRGKQDLEQLTDEEIQTELQRLGAA